MIHLRHVSHNFGSHWALKNFSLDLDKGGFLFLVGPSGAGKTTLLRILHGAIALQRGQAVVCGFDLQTIKPKAIPLLRREVSVVFQDFKILPQRTVFANVALALEVRNMPRPLLQRRVRAVLRGLDLESKAHVSCAELSGGEQQRVAVARAVVVGPQLLLADEPTGNLDRELAMRLMSLFLQFHAHGSTVILATHNQELLSCLPEAKIVHIEDGSIVWANWSLTE
ncbi:MAG TPA: cell division ATP-binding protein FtsE [Desulfonatronum sp.]|mgnify:CR=1 FL=1|nr:cell division ATP-binding protein FtsE [Desulfonatronum sp.]